MASRKFGDWGKVRDILGNASKQINEAAKKALLQEGHFLRGEMVKGIRDQAPGGKAFKPLSPLTLAARRLNKFRGTKALMVRGDLRNSISVSFHRGTVFVGVLRTAKSKKGKPLINIAEVQEYGVIFALKITPKMRKFLAVLYREAYDERALALQSWFRGGRSMGKSMLVIRIPARPYVRPTFEKHAKPGDVRKRLEERMAKLLRGSFAK